MIVSAGITEHIEGLSQLIRWQDVTTSTLKNSQKTVKKSQKGTIKGDQTCTRTLLFLQESLSTLSRGLFQLIRVARRLQISVRSDLSIKTLKFLQDQTGQAILHSGQECFIRVACLWSKMPMVQRAGMREGGEPLPLAFQYLILMI